MQTNVLFCSDFSLHFLIDLFCNQKFPITHIFYDMFKENFLSHLFLFCRNFIKKKKENFILKLQFFFDLGDKIMILTQSTDSVIYYNQTFMNNSSSHFFILQVVKRNIPFDIKLSLNSYKKIKYTESKITNNRMLFFILFLFKKFKNSIYTFTENLNFSEDRFKFFLEWSLCIRKYDYWHKMKVFYLDSDYQLKNISKLFLTNKKLLKSSKKIFLYFKSSSIFKYHRYKLLKFFKKKFTHNYEKYIYNRIFHSFLNAKYLAFYKISKFLSKDMNLDMT